MYNAEEGGLLSVPCSADLLILYCVCQQTGLNVPGPTVKYSTTTTSGDQVHSAGEFVIVLLNSVK